MKKLDEAEQIMFKFDITNEELLDQSEFLYGYYVAKLQLLKKYNAYISKNKEAEETFYKDMITACACYHQEVLTKQIKNERTDTEGGEIP